MLQDAQLMLEWMHDGNVVNGVFENDFSCKTLEDCKRFIRTARQTRENIHLAIADENDEYMGTVSLKYIHDGSAEFAIVVRSVAMGKGFAKYAMAEIIRLGMEELGLRKIYWYVKPSNERALHFYDKNGYARIASSEITCGGMYPDAEKFVWYLMGG